MLWLLFRWFETVLGAHVICKVSWCAAPVHIKKIEGNSRSLAEVFSCAIACLHGVLGLLLADAAKFMNAECQRKAI